MKKIKVNLISESVFTVQGHGVHTAFLEMERALRKSPDIDLIINGKPDEDIDISHIHTIGGFALRRLLSKKGGKKIISAHVVPDSVVGSLVGAKFWVWGFRLYLKWFYNKGDAVIAVSPYTRDELLKIGVKKPIIVLPNSIDTEQYKNSNKQKLSYRKELGLPKDKFIVIGNGQIQPRKRFDIFVDIAKKLSDIQFIWIGGIPFKAAGADYPRLNSMIKKHPKNLLVTDVIQLVEAQKYMKTGDLMFMPSSQETFGLAIIEGAACGMPVIVRDIHDYDETFGEYVTRGNDDNFIDLIKKYRTDKKIYKDGQDKSHKLAKIYDAKEAVKKLISLYRDQLKN